MGASYLAIMWKLLSRVPPCHPADQCLVGNLLRHAAHWRVDCRYLCWSLLDHHELLLCLHCGAYEGEGAWTATVL